MAATAKTAIPLLLALAAAAAVAVSGQKCKHSKSHYSVLASHNASGPWEAALSVRRHDPSPNLHFSVRPASFSQTEKLTITLKGQMSLERLEADGADGYEEAEGAGWYKVHPERVTWAEARAACEAEGAHLVVVDAPAEAAALRALLAVRAPATSLELHAGFLAEDYAASFVTVQGQPLSAAGYEGWGFGQPDMSICGRVDQLGLLRDGMCDWMEPASFVCERESFLAAAENDRAPAPTSASNATAPPSPPTAAPSDYEAVTPHGGDSVYKLHVQPVTWWEAKARCEAEGAHLAVLNSEAESYVITELVRRAGAGAGAGEGEGQDVLPYVYIGARAELNFVTVFGKPLSQAPFDLWAMNYPVFKNCVAVNHKGTLWVTQCWAKYPFVCEYDAS